MAMGLKAFENPLIGHARMRAMYRALVEARALAPTLGPKHRLPRGLEACWVGTAIGLAAGDLTSDARGSAAIDHIRETGQRNSGSSRAFLRRLAKRQPPVAEAAFERLLCAAGAALALKSCGSSLVVAYVSRDDLNRSEWLRLLAIATRGDVNRALPMILVVTPARTTMPDLDSVARTAGKPLGRRVPVLPVDAADAVALYRAAQESFGRARSTGGAVIIECLRSSSDPIRLLGEQLVAKRICTPAWCATVQKKALP